MKTLTSLCTQTHSLKGTVRVITSETHWKKAIRRFKIMPFKALSILCLNYILMFTFLKTDYFQTWFLNKIYMRISTAGKPSGMIRIKLFQPRNTTISFTVLIR